MERSVLRSGTKTLATVQGKEKQVAKNDSMLQTRPLSKNLKCLWDWIRCYKNENLFGIMKKMLKSNNGAGEMN